MKKTVYLLLGAMILLMVPTNSWAQAPFKATLKSAKRGDAVAQTQVGNRYFYGDGVKQSYKKAAKWYGKAADQGVAVAQFNLGVSYFFGDGVRQNYEKAVECFKKAAYKNHPKAQFFLGYCYAHGYGVEEDKFQSFEWYLKAAKQGDEEAQNNLGYKKTVGKPPNGLKKLNTKNFLPHLRIMD